MRVQPLFSLVFSYRTVPSALELPQIVPPAVACGLYRRSGIGKALLAFPHPAPKTLYTSTLVDERWVAYVTRDRTKTRESSLGCLSPSFESSLDPGHQ